MENKLEKLKQFRPGTVEYLKALMEYTSDNTNEDGTPAHGPESSCAIDFCQKCDEVSRSITDY